METVTKEKAEARKEKLFGLRDDMSGTLTALEKARYAAETIGHYFASTIETEEEKKTALYFFDTHRIASDILGDYLYEVAEAARIMWNNIDELCKAEISGGTK